MATSEGQNNLVQAAHRSHLHWAGLLMVLALTAALRLPGIGRPLLGNFATKQAVYGMIARNWGLGRAELAYPTIDVLCGGRRGLHLLEFPVSAYVTATGWRTVGGPLDVWGRATSAAWSLAAVGLMYGFVRRRHSAAAAFGASLAVALSPVSVIYGQSFMLEASLVCFTLLAFFAWDRWLDLGGPLTGGRCVFWLLTAGAGLALLLLTKIYMAVVLLPLGAMVVRGGASRRRATVGLVALAAAVLPAACWYGLAYQAAEPGRPLADRVFYSVRASAETHHPPHPLLFSAEFYRGVLDDLSGVVLTPLGFTLALAGLINRQWRRYGVWLGMSVLLVLLLPRKFHEMNYYWMAVLPPLAVLVGLGWEQVQRRMQPGRAAAAMLLLIGVVFSLRYAVKPALVTPEEDRGVVPAAAALREFVEDANEPVVAVHGTSLDLLYYCNRPGWAVSPKNEENARRLAECRRAGARFAVLVGTKLPELGEPAAEGHGYRVYRLREDPPD